MDKVILTGRLTKDIEIKQTDSGVAYTRFSIAVDRYVNKEKGTKTIFVDCSAFGHSANYLGKYAKRGNKVLVEGELDSNKKESDDGRLVTYWSVVVNNVELLESKQQSNDDEQPYEL